jgi:hypothetical protein
MDKHEQLYNNYLSILDNQEKQWRETSEKAHQFGDKEEYVKLQIKSGIATMCKALFIKTYKETYGEK